MNRSLTFSHLNWKLRLSNHVRLPCLDALRSFCMLFGILVHATTVADFGWLEGFATISDLFRMATFFAVSAFLSGVVLTRRPASAFLKRRLCSLSIPLVFALVVLNPPTLWLVAKVHNPGQSFGIGEVLAQSLGGSGNLDGPLVWHLHLWFLFSLLAFSLIGPALLQLLRSARVQRVGFTLVNRVPRSYRVPALAFLAMGLSLLLRVGSEIVAPTAMDFWLVRATLLYLPFFITGLLLFAFPTFWRDTPFPWGLLGLLVLLIPMQVASTAEPAGPLVQLLRFGLDRLITASAVLVLFKLSMALLNQDNPLIRFVVDGIYTLYIVHYLLIYLIAWALAPLDLPQAVLFWLIAAMVTTVGLGFHALVVRRSRLLTFLLNGIIASPGHPRTPPLRQVGSA